MKYSGIDLHSSNCVLVVTDEQDHVLEEKRVPNDLVVILKLLEPYREDLAGVVVSSEDGDFPPGTEVLMNGCGLSETVDGGYSEYARVNGRGLVPIPDGMTCLDAMRIGTAGYTAALAIHRMEQNGQSPDQGLWTHAPGSCSDAGNSCQESPKSRLARISRSTTFSRFSFGSSIPITDRPGTVDTRALSAIIDRAISSASPITRLAFRPGAGSSSYMVTTGPGRTLTISPLTP